MRTKARNAIWLAALAVALTSAEAHASDPAAAQVLFEEGKKLVDAGRYDEACPKLRQSQELDPAGGTLLHLANCYDLAGKTASAWLTYNEALSWARRDKRKDREKAAQARIDKLVPRLSRLEIRVSDAVRATIGLRVTRDGAELSQAEWNNAVPVDPGEHEVGVSAPGHTTWSKRITISAPGTITVEVQAPEAESAPTPTPTPVASKADAPLKKPVRTEPESAPPASEAPTERDSGAPPRSGGLSGQRKIALGVGVVGVVGVGVGTFFGLRSMSKKSDADKHCDGSVCRDQMGVDLRSEARSAGNLSTIGFALGGVGLAAAAALWLTAPSSTPTALEVSPLVGQRGAGLGVRGQW